MKIDKKILQKLVNEIIHPLEEVLILKLQIVGLDEKEAVEILKNIGLLKMVLIVFDEEIDNKKIEELLLQIDEMDKCRLEKFYIYSLLIQFFNDIKIFIESENLLNICQCEKLNDIITNLHLKKDEAKKGSEEREDDFFDFDDFSEDRDENMDNMHYEDGEKITAKEYMSFNEVDQDFIEDLNEHEEEFEAVKFAKNSIDKEYIEKFTKIVSLYAHTFSKLKEFTDMEYSLHKFIEILKNLDLEQQKDNLELLKILFESVIDDLHKWKESILINQDALDIHYLDASLLANLVQIEISINSYNKEENEDDEMEFF